MLFGIEDDNALGDEAILETDFSTKRRRKKFPFAVGDTTGLIVIASSSVFCAKANSSVSNPPGDITINWHGNRVRDESCRGKRSRLKLVSRRHKYSIVYKLKKQR